jgi:hypothetical protein
LADRDLVDDLADRHGFAALDEQVEHLDAGGVRERAEPARVGLGQLSIQHAHPFHR